MLFVKLTYATPDSPEGIAQELSVNAVNAEPPVRPPLVNAHAVAPSAVVDSESDPPAEPPVVPLRAVRAVKGWMSRLEPEGHEVMNCARSVKTELGPRAVSNAEGTIWRG